MDGATEGPVHDAPTASRSKGGVLYEDANAALVAVLDRFNYGTAKLTDSSFQLSLAVIGTNWAVFGSVDKILVNVWAQGSITVVLVGLGLNLVGTKFMAELLRKRIDYAEGNVERWKQEFDETMGRVSPWPFTRHITFLSRFLRECKTWAPIVGGVLFLFALARSLPGLPVVG